MEIIRKALKLEGKEYYSMHLRIINPFLPEGLTGTEIDILASFMSLGPEITAGDVFNTYARKVIKESLGKMSSGSLSNHIRSMKEKKLLDENSITGRITIKSFLIPERSKQGYQFKIAHI